ncbi:MAG TPA: TolC family protein [Polyangiaceae bacterium]|nr:TolC family protein [Polyangiaceae bacterium]
MFRSVRSLPVLLVLSVEAPCLAAPPDTVNPDAPPALSEGNSQARRVGLREAIDYARAHHPVILASLARVAASRADTEIPRALWYPTAGISAQIFAATANNTTGTYVGPDQFDLPRIGGTRVVSSPDWAPSASTLVGIGARQELFDFGRIAARAAAVDTLVDLEQQAARADELDVTFDVEEAYFAVYSARAVLKASEDAYQRSKAHRDLAKAGVASGLRSPIELTRAEADLTRFDIGRLKAQGGVFTAEVVLAAAVGVPDASLDIAEAPPAPGELPSLADAIRQGVRRDPAVLEAVASLRAAEATTRAIGAELRPDVAATATFSGRAGGATPSGNGVRPAGSGFLPDVPNWDAGLVLNVPLFDGVINAREDAARARERVRTEELAAANQREIAAIRRAYVATDVARAALPRLSSAVDAARANYAQAEARFNAGLGTSVELADAEAVRTDAEIQLALGQFELARARARFGRAIAEGI